MDRIKNILIMTLFWAGLSLFVGFIGWFMLSELSLAFGTWVAIAFFGMSVVKAGLAIREIEKIVG